MLRISETTMVLSFKGTVKLPYWLGSTLRGGLGHVLREMVCDSGLDCNECGENCLYYHLYERRESKRGHASPPKPVILVPPFFGREMFWRDGGEITVRLLMLGDFIKYFPIIVLSISELGKKGLGSERVYDINRFVLKEVRGFSGELLFNGSEMRIPPPSIDVREVDPIEGDKFRVYFRTPYTGRTFPLGPREFLSRTRNRLIRFVNEYGDSSYIEEPEAKGRILRFEKHVHFLRRKSERSGKMTLTGFTGIIDYEFSEIDEVGRWLLGVANLLGLGPDSSFGLGFVKVTRLEDSH